MDSAGSVTSAVRVVCLARIEMEVPYSVQSVNRAAGHTGDHADRVSEPSALNTRGKTFCVEGWSRLWERARHRTRQVQPDPYQKRILFQDPRGNTLRGFWEKPW